MSSATLTRVSSNMQMTKTDWTVLKTLSLSLRGAENENFKNLDVNGNFERSCLDSCCYQELKSVISSRCET